MARPAGIDFLTPVGAIPGFGDRRCEALAESDIRSVGDLLYYFPRRYIDRSTIVPLAQAHLHPGAVITVRGAVTRTRVEKGRRARMRALVDDGSGSIELLWFHGIPYVRAAIRTGMRLLATGRVTLYTGLQMVHPLTETLPEGRDRPDMPHLPQYRVTAAMKRAGLQQKGLVKAVAWSLKNVRQFPRVLPPAFEERNAFPPLELCLTQLHRPGDPAALEQYRRRIRYEDFYSIAVTLAWNRRAFRRPGRPMSAGDWPQRFERSLPFTLTAAQRGAVAVLHADAASPRRMHRLLQGDVGCGKTVTAFLACLPALREGYQVAWLAPTEMLAVQAHRQIGAWLAVFGIDAGLLTAAVAPERKRAVVSGLRDGSIKCVVGTHALLEPGVVFSRLGMIVIDEQHKFGANQRRVLQEKDPAADFLLMSATPIPQTLARTLYGDLDVVTVPAGPEGRKPVSTHLVPQSRRADMEAFVRREITDGGGRAYCIVPRVEPDDDEEAGLKDAETTFRRMRDGPFRGIACGFIHGQTAPREREQALSGFSSGGIRMLVATTVVEVGIDAPAATVMIIENAERFGLAQLHQLRGRVGRAHRQSYCFLMASHGCPEHTLERLREFCRLHDGFKIAEMDLQYRGPGQVAGTMQSGWDDARMAGVLEDVATFREVQAAVDEMMAAPA